MLLGKVIAAGLGILLVVWLVVGAFRQVHYGEAAVVAADVLIIEGREYSLWAVKIPEVAETCESPRGAWPCGAFATAALLLEVTDKSAMCFGKAERAERIRASKVLRLGESSGLEGRIARTREAGLGEARPRGVARVRTDFPRSSGRNCRPLEAVGGLRRADSSSGMLGIGLEMRIFR